MGSIKEDEVQLSLLLSSSRFIVVLAFVVDQILRRHERQFVAEIFIISHLRTIFIELPTTTTLCLKKRVSGLKDEKLIESKPIHKI